MTGARGTIVLDLDGVVYLDTQGVPGAAEALRTLQDAGFSFRYATNNSSKTAPEVARHIGERTGFRADPKDAVTSSQCTAGYVAERYGTAHVIGPAALAHELTDRGVELVGASAPDCVVVGLDRRFTYDSIDRAARAIRSGAAFVASNTDPTYPTPTGLAPGAGTIVAALATASGIDPVVCGKPAAIFAEAVAAGLDQGPTWMVGDRMETDIAMGASMGWTTILVLTGVTEAAAIDAGGLAPDHVIASIADLPEVVLGSASPPPIAG